LNTRLLTAVMAASILAPCAANAQSATPVPDKKPDFGPMSMFMGVWNCKRLKAPNNRGIGVVFKSTTTVTLDDRWMETDSTTPPYDAMRTRDNVGKSWLTYDPDTKLWVSLGIDNFGGYGVTTSPGWTGNTLVTTDKMNASGAPLGVDTLTKISDTQFHDIYSVKTPKGTEIYENSCTKAT
jgi:hypothetical protein